MKKLSATQFDGEVIHSELPVLVDFYTEECGPCREVARMLNEIESMRGDALKMVKVNAASEISLAVAYHVQGVPTLLLFKNGNCVGQLVGMRSKQLLSRWIDETIGQST